MRGGAVLTSTFRVMFVRFARCESLYGESGGVGQSSRDVMPFQDASNVIVKCVRYEWDFEREEGILFWWFSCFVSAGAGMLVQVCVDIRSVQVSCACLPVRLVCVRRRNRGKRVRIH